MEQFIITIAFCIAGCLVGWEANSCIQKFKQDRKGMKLAQLKEDVLAKAREDALKGINPNNVKDPIILAAEKIIADHLAKNNVLKSIRDSQRGKED